MVKNFDEWGGKKKEIQSQITNIYFHEREVWWCALGVNIGCEQDGTGKHFDRPVVIVKGFSRNILFCVALTTKNKWNEHHFYLGSVSGRAAFAVLSQVRLIDAKRLIRKITILDENLFSQLKFALKRELFD